MSFFFPRKLDFGGKFSDFDYQKIGTYGQWKKWEFSNMKPEEVLQNIM